jgi:hypothetical protein
VPLEILEGESDFLVRSRQLVRTALGRPLESALRERRFELREIDAVASGIGRRTLCEGDLAVRQPVVNDLGEVANAIVLRGRADV